MNQIAMNEPTAARRIAHGKTLLEGRDKDMKAALAAFCLLLSDVEFGQLKIGGVHYPPGGPPYDPEAKSTAIGEFDAKLEAMNPFGRADREPDLERLRRVGVDRSQGVGPAPLRHNVAVPTQHPNARESQSKFARGGRTVVPDGHAQISVAAGSHQPPPFRFDGDANHAALGSSTALEIDGEGGDNQADNRDGNGLARRIGDSPVGAKIGSAIVFALLATMVLFGTLDPDRYDQRRRGDLRRLTAIGAAALLYAATVWCILSL